MITLGLEVKNPWYRENFANLFNWSKALTKNKVFEFEVTRYSYDLFRVYLTLNCTGADHAGPKLELSLFGYSVSLQVYDTRHWDYNARQWTVYDDND